MRHHPDHLAVSIFLGSKDFCGQILYQNKTTLNTPVNKVRFLQLISIDPVRLNGNGITCSKAGCLSQQRMLNVMYVLAG